MSIRLAPALVTAVQEQRAILFLGSGASVGAKHPKGATIPMGNALRDQISDKFLGGEMRNRPLTAVSAMAASEAGLTLFQKFIRDLFIDFRPSETHKLIPTFRWRAIVTTNFDLIIERAYEASRGSIQTLVTSWKDGDAFDSRMHDTPDPVGYYKLHGCIDRFADETIPLILGQEQYASYSKNRQRFYLRLRDLAYDNPIIFCGYSISDPHIQQFLFDLTDHLIQRPMYYCVSPDMSDVETRYWAGHHVGCISATFSDFLQEIDGRISVNARRLRRGASTGGLSLQAHYRVAGANESDALRYYLQSDVMHVYSGMVPPRQEPTEFYKGYDTGFGCITQDLDTPRAISDSILVDAILVDDEARKNGELFLIKGPGGNGKTVTLKRVAWEAATSYDRLVLYANGPQALQFEPLKEIYDLTGQRIFLIVDRIALVREDLQRLLGACRSRKLPVSVIGAERENEWHIYCENLEGFVHQEFSVLYLSDTEIKDLLGRLEHHRALGLLADRTPEERLDAFLKRAESQLLVALHETTLGVPFESIVLDEYNRVKPEEAQTLYLQICALHQFGAPVRAGLISRTSGINFKHFGERFLKPLAEVVIVEEDAHTSGDVFYRSRHQHVAELVFNQVLRSGEDKYDLLATLIQAMNIDYTSDGETFSRLMRGRAVAAMFSSAELGRLLYDKAEAAAGKEAFVAHQRAVFELQHPHGSLANAERAASRGVEINPRSRSIRHTQAEIARRQALATRDPLLQQSYRRSAKDKLGGDAGPLSEYDLHTRAKIATDELREALGRGGEMNELTSTAILSATRDAETAILRGRSSFPESSEILAAEADLRDLLNQAPQAQTSLERAFRLNPRQDWLAIRLAKRYAEAGDIKKAIATIQQCLRENPESKSAHMQIALFLMRTDASQTNVLEHLRRSFTRGDNNFDGQFWYARELFLGNRCSEADTIFSNISENAPGRFRVDASAPAIGSRGEPINYEGAITRKEEGYAFVRLLQFSDEVFASRGDSGRREWDILRAGGPVTCFLSFTRRGPKATRITPRRI
jgi:tetratricopeptide (TPR) repeat protein